ncbi:MULTISPECIES: methylated-DNA--[protein]-cysteine S-methyltransferase [unclassified Iodidimonas]|jgi:methylated-DNA-[protein]-cysteine S-methyltransferase|uniref:methylated-DNA--[protein]-cysteine S-methyltransferase n=1 Tax=unclassified Iodidimonas TaxID=2626145 RepID=UPI002482F096|nr:MULTISPECIES: methylated-DNA--[protein]-cysteine S-methyltransferase [unclassified Iodidimonas]
MGILSLHSPLGDLTLFEEDDHIIALEWGWGDRQQPSPLLIEAAQQVQDYFDGVRTLFDLPLNPHGSDFQKRAWSAISQIPYGTTQSYGELAHKIGTKARAMGSACRTNPIPIIIPCHRVLSAQGNLTGYSGMGGLDSKAALIRLEGIAPQLPL